MKKRLIGTALMASSLMLVSHPLVMNPGENQQSGAITESVTRSMPAGQIPVKWVKTIDGDTIKVKLSGKLETVRYLLMDTPESKKPGLCVQPYAKEASERNNQLVSSGRLTLEYEPKDQRDAYGRLLAYVYVDGQSVQETLLKEGFARVAYIMNPPYKYLSIYRNDETEAKSNKLKIWSRPNYVTRLGFNGCAE